jgi:proline racemase
MQDFANTDGAIAATDVMIAGDVLRVAHGGLPELCSQNPADGLIELRTRYESLRAFLNDPPHGNLLVNSCFLYPASQPFSAGRHFLASRFGYSPFAGTALMACAAVRAEASQRLFKKPSSPLIFETARGLAQVEIAVEDTLTGRATWIAALPSVLIAEQMFDIPNRGKIRLSIISSGLPYIVVEDRELGVPINDLPRVAQAAMALSAAVGRDKPVADFGVAEDYARYLVMVVNATNKDDVPVVWVSDKGEAARSAGGTGALAVLAALQARGLRQPCRTVAIRAPGGSFQCRIDDSSAVVTATTRIVARHELLNPPF